jgi:hypothetical protein
MYGVIEFGGRKYIERYRDIPQEITVSVALGLQNNITLVPSGTYPFLLKLLTMKTVEDGATVEHLFKYRLGNSDGGVYYIGNDTATGTGGVQTRVLSTLTFGDAQSPYALIPPIFFDRNGAMLIEIEDVSNVVPYTAFFGYKGSFLIPV